MKFLMVMAVILAACTVPNDPIETVKYVDKVVEVPVEVPVIVEVPVEVPVYIYPEPEPVADPEPPPSPPEPVWTPEPGHVYIFDSSGEMVGDFSAVEMGYDYATLWMLIGYDVELHNIDFPGDPWHRVGGGP